MGYWRAFITHGAGRAICRRLTRSRTNGSFTVRKRGLSFSLFQFPLNLDDCLSQHPVRASPSSPPSLPCSFLKLFPLLCLGLLFPLTLARSLVRSFEKEEKIEERERETPKEKSLWAKAEREGVTSACCAYTLVLNLLCLPSPPARLGCHCCCYYWFILAWQPPPSSSLFSPLKFGDIIGHVGRKTETRPYRLPFLCCYDGARHITPVHYQGHNVCSVLLPLLLASASEKEQLISIGHY